MKKSKWLALILAMLMIITLFTGCGKNDSSSDEPETKATEQAAEDEEEAEEEKEEAKAEAENSYDNFKVSKIGSFEADKYALDVYASGLSVLGEDGKYTVISLDGSTVTPTEYTSCRTEDKYFTVSKTTPENDTDFAGINSCGLIDSYGKLIIPLEYASVDVLNERYAKVIIASEKTQNKDEALVYYTDAFVSIAPGEDDILYKGTWYIYDMEKGNLVDGVSGTLPYVMSAKGDYFTYVSDDQEKVTRNAEGNVLDSSVSLYDNGSYFTDNVVYDTDGKEMFSIDDGFRPGSYTNGYYVCSQYIDDTTKYVIKDEAGKVISAQFNEYINEVYENAVLSDGVLYDFEGNEIHDNCYTVTFDNLLGKYYFIEDDNDNGEVIDLEGNTLASFTADDNRSIYKSDFAASEKKDNTYYYYSFADKAFTYFHASAIAPWIVMAKGDSEITSFYDTLSGERLIGDYGQYQYVETEDGVYVYGYSDAEVWDVYYIEAK